MQTGGGGGTETESPRRRRRIEPYRKGKRRSGRRTTTGLGLPEAMAAAMARWRGRRRGRGSGKSHLPAWRQGVWRGAVGKCSCSCWAQGTISSFAAGLRANANEAVGVGCLDFLVLLRWAVAVRFRARLPVQCYPPKQTCSNQIKSSAIRCKVSVERAMRTTLTVTEQPIHDPSITLQTSRQSAATHSWWAALQKEANLMLGPHVVIWNSSTKIICPGVGRSWAWLPGP